MMNILMIDLWESGEFWESLLVEGFFENFYFFHVRRD